MVDIEIKNNFRDKTLKDILKVFSLNRNITVLKISLMYVSKFFYNFFARIPQTLMEEIETGIIESTSSFLSKRTIPPKSPG